MMAKYQSLLDEKTSQEILTSTLSPDLNEFALPLCERLNEDETIAEVFIARYFSSWR